MNKELSKFRDEIRMLEATVATLQQYMGGHMTELELRAARQSSELRTLNAVVQRKSYQIKQLRAERAAYTTAGTQFRIRYTCASVTRPDGSLVAMTWWEGHESEADDIDHLLAVLRASVEDLKEAWVESRDVSEWHADEKDEGDEGDGEDA